MSGDRDNREQDEELEALLRRLVPTPPSAEFLSELDRTRERVRSGEEESPMRMQWSRVIPLTLVCTVVMFGFALYRYGDRLVEARRAAPSAEAAVAVASDTAVAPGDAGLRSPGPRFVPVSSHGTIVETSSRGLVETESGPSERLNVEYRDAYHWHDPESGTNIRFFRPRTEEVIVPLPAN